MSREKIMNPIDDRFTIRMPKVIAYVKVAGLCFSIDDTMDFKMPTKRQIKRLKRTFGIEVVKAEDRQ